MGKIYKRIWRRVPRLSHIGRGGGRGIKIKRRPNANLIRGGNRGGRCAGGGKGHTAVLITLTVILKVTCLLLISKSEVNPGEVYYFLLLIPNPPY